VQSWFARAIQRPIFEHPPYLPTRLNQVIGVFQVAASGMPGKIMEGGAMSDTFGYPRAERDNGLARMRSRERVRLILTRVGVAVLLIWFVSSWYVDAMAVSGFLTAFVGLWLSTYIESGFARTMSRLQADRVFGPDVAKIEDVVLTLERHASRTQQFSAAAVVIFVLAGYLYSFGSGVFGQKLEFTLLSVLTGALAGFRIGVAIAYGRLGAALERAGVQLSLIPGHPDDAGGTKPIGDFLLFQGWLLGLPMVWLTVWLIIVSSSSDLDYAPWRLPFFALWLLTAVFFWLGTIVPINAFRGLMLEERAQFTKRFDAELDDRAGAALAQRARAREWSEFVTPTMLWWKL
jgi:hypothetical protein